MISDDTFIQLVKDQAETKTMVEALHLHLLGDGSAGSGKIADLDRRVKMNEEQIAYVKGGYKVLRTVTAVLTTITGLVEGYFHLAKK